MYTYPQPFNASQGHPMLQSEGPPTKRLPIDLLLNPIIYNTPHSPPTTSQVVLPSIESLDLPVRSHTSRKLHIRQLQQHHQSSRPHHRHHASHSSQDSQSSRSSRSRSHASSRSESPTLSSHSNVPYTLEQVHYIQYLREDKKVQWQSIVEPFKRQFPNVVFQQVKGPRRGKGALECRYYRAQLYPQLDQDGNAVVDQNGDVVMINIRVRDRPSHHRNIVENYVKLVTRCPEKVLEYPWTNDEDKAKARRIIETRSKQGLGFLPGAILRVRSHL